MNQEPITVEQLRRYAALISKVESDDIICSVTTATWIQDCEGFQSVVEPVQTPSFICKIGILCTKNIFIDINMKCGDGRIFDAEKNVILELPECEKITDETLKTYLSEQHINTRNDAIDTLNELRSKLDPDHENDEFNYLFEKIIAAIMNIGKHSPIQSSDQTILEKIKTYAATPINLGLMTNERMLELIRLDQPWQVINEVKSFTLNKYGYYEVEVDMEGHFFKTKIQHVRTTLPYPYLTHQKIKESLRPIVQPAPQPRK